MKSTGIVRHDAFLNHLTEEGHPENKGRLESIYAMLDGPDMQKRFVEIEPRPASEEEVCLVHAPEYLEQIAATEGREYSRLTADTHASAGSYQAALLAAGGVLTAIERVHAGELSHAFALVRPPGHHAERSRAMGFCLFGNAAMGAMFARRELGLKRVLIIDWDVHHGNGTQHAFEADPSVLFFSLHQHPLFPGTGVFTETGLGPGEGCTVNLPLPKGYGDGEYAAIFERLLRPLAIEFAPELILVSAGFDTHAADPLGGMRMTTAGFGGLTRSLMETAKTCGDGKLVFILEGGYDRESMAACTRAVLDELTGATISSASLMAEQAAPKKVRYALSRCRHVHRQFWKSLEAVG